MTLLFIIFTKDSEFALNNFQFIILNIRKIMIGILILNVYKCKLHVLNETSYFHKTYQTLHFHVKQLINA